MTEIPTERAKFKQWADRSCIDWPGQLQRTAYAAWLDFNLDNDALEKFKSDYNAFRMGKCAT